MHSYHFHLSPWLGHLGSVSLNLKSFCVLSPVSTDSMEGKGHELGETALASAGNADSMAGP